MNFHFYEAKKRVRRQYVHNAKRHKWSKQLEVGMQGILITCNQSGWKCVPEACSLLTEYGDLLYGAEKQCEKDDKPKGSEEQEEDDDDDEGESAQTAPEKEVDQSQEKNLHRFQSLESGASNLLFVRSFNIEPEKLVHHILKDLYTTKQKKTQFLLRMLPVCGTCRAVPEDFRKYAETFLQPWFKAPNKGNFQIMFKARYNNSLNRDMVVDDLTVILCRLNQKNRLDPINPDYTIVVEVIWNVCCLGVVKDYNLFKKYNLQEVIKSGGEEGKETAQEVQDDQTVGSNT